MPSRRAADDQVDHASAAERRAEAVARRERREAALRPVKVGRRNGTVAQVLEGLRAGERVILHPSDTIAAGSRVEAR